MRRIEVVDHRSLLFLEAPWTCRLTSVLRRPVAQNIRQERHQPAQRGDVSDSPRRDVLDPADDSSRQLGVCGEVQYERAVGW